MSLFKSKEERAISKAEKKRLKMEKWERIGAEAQAQIDKINVETAEKKAIYEERIAKRGERIAEIDAHNKAVIQDWLGDVRRIKNDFVQENRQISQQNHQKIQERHNDSDQDYRVAALQSLKALLDSGVLTQEEFETEKARILSND